MKKLAVLALVALLVGCGGGDCDSECLKDFDPVNCKADPKLCI